MMSRNLLLGFGLGLMFSASFLFLTGGLTKQPAAWTVDEIKQAAGAQNLVLLSKQEYDHLKQQQQEKRQLERGGEEKVQVADLASPKPPIQPGAVQPPAQTAAPIVNGVASTTPVNKAALPETTATHPASPQPVKVDKASSVPVPSQPYPAAVPKSAPTTVSFRVAYGDNSTEVAQNLVKAGLLIEKNSFIERLRQQNKLDRIRTGTFSIPKGATEDDIVKILTTPPKR
jgi:hypothetical protein